MKFDSYSITARIFPAILSSVPFFVLHFYYLRPTLGQFWDDLLTAQIVSDITIALVFLFLLIQVSRYISKEFFEKSMFADGLSLPTTDYLLHLNSHFSPEYTIKIHAKIKSDFDIEIPSAKEEATDTKRSRKLITEVVGQIREKVGDGRLVSQHNAEYGFSRNLAGGSVAALFISLVDVGVFWFIFNNPVALWLSAILSTIYLLAILFSRKIILAFGNHYAQKLIEEYMSK